MPTDFCPTCGKSLNSESRHPCKCGATSVLPSPRGISGKRFVAILALIALVVSLIAFGLYLSIPVLRMEHGLSGFHH